MKKVYCKNCKFNTSFVELIVMGASHTRVCGAIKQPEEINKYTGKIIQYKKYFKDFSNNDKGECPHYKKKWWKFWL